MPPSRGPIPLLQPTRPQADLQSGESTLDIRRFADFRALTESGQPLSLEQMIKLIMLNSEIDITLRTLNLGARARMVTVLTTPTLIIPQAKSPRAYKILNPAVGVPLAPLQIPFASAARAAGVFNSAAFNVSVAESVRFFLDVTANATPLTLTVNLQTRDPLTLNWATPGTTIDIFGGAAAVGTYYVDLGPQGIDHTFRLVATVGAGAGTMTFSISAYYKGGSDVAGETVYYSTHPDVNITVGFPILRGQIETFYLKDNTQIWGLTQTDPVNLKVFQLQ